MAGRYQSGKVYCLRNSVNDDVYVGSTIQDLARRLSKHFSDARRHPGNQRITSLISELGADKFSIELLESYPCESVQQLRRKEGEWVRRQGTLNTMLPGRTRAEYYTEHRDALTQKMREYYSEHREERSQKSFERRETHREEDRHSSRKYYHQNREAIREKKNSLVDCLCGSRHTVGGNVQHLKSAKHQAYLAREVEEA